ncbi:copper resistance protein B [Kordiimonas lipolytica]|uniref:Copper resistance protein B n=1 Tax=Kordiimonas lipolytica TaxID=1662421 RepID=A0ABV8UBP7_9PROT|nr:copper resistance protein B [Kordiimonas lipolytica]
MSHTKFKKIAILPAAIFLFSEPSLLAQEMPMPQVEATMNKEAKDKPSMQGGKIPPDARDPNANSGGYEYRHMDGWEDTDMISVSKVIFDQFEYRNNGDSDVLRWDVQGWRGTDYSKFWFKFEGVDELSSNNGEMELQTLYSRAVSPFWDFQVGARYDVAYGTGSSGDRAFAVIGLQGLAPYWFELEPAIFLSDGGDISGRVVATYDLLFSQRLILQSRFETNFSLSEARKYDVGKGINDIQLGLRMRYEIRREFAPYVGLEWNRKLGSTAKILRDDGVDPSSLSFVTGLRLWF